jgi:hypothetical protein
MYAWDVVAQLRDLLLAEDSAEVPDYREQDIAALPGGAEARALAFGS